MKVPNMTTLLAPVRFKPVPPASVEMTKMNTSGSLLNLSIIGIPDIYVRSSPRKIITHDPLALCCRPVSETCNLSSSTY